MFSDVLQGGPAGDADLRRGDEVLAIDVGSGFETIAQLSERQATSAEVFGGNQRRAYSGAFACDRSQGVVEVTLTKRELVTPAPSDRAFAVRAIEGHSPVGYLNLRSFISTANGEL